MGAIGSMLGTAGGVNGTGFSKPGQADILNTVNPEDIKNTSLGAQQGIQSQQDLLNALQGQNGIGNQSDVFGQTQNLVNQLGRTSSVYNQNKALNNQNALAGQQQGLANQYQAVANGQGPNPAQNMLNQATGQNVANQAALMAGQRGAGANVGLMARQAGQAGAGIQQNAVGQAATMQSQQQLNALAGLGAQQQAIGNTYNNVAGIAGQQIGAQQAGQAALANQANQQVNQQMGATTGYSQGLQNEQAQMLGAAAAQNNAKVSSTGNMNNNNASMANTSMQGQQGVVGGVLSGAGAAIGLADGGEIPPVSQPVQPQGPASAFGQFLSGWGGGMGSGDNSGDSAPLSNMGSQNPGSKSINQGMTSIGAGINQRMNAPLQVGPGTPIAGPDASSMPGSTMTAAEGGLASSGGKVAAKSPDQKASKKGNSFDNDKIPAVLSEHEIVLPRTVTLSSDPARSAYDFVNKVIAKRRSK